MMLICMVIRYLRYLLSDCSEATQLLASHSQALHADEALIRTSTMHYSPCAFGVRLVSGAVMPETL